MSIKKTKAKLAACDAHITQVENMKSSFPTADLSHLTHYFQARRAVIANSIGRHK